MLVIIAHIFFLQSLHKKLIIYFKVMNLQVYFIPIFILTVFTKTNVKILTNNNKFSNYK